VVDMSDDREIPDVPLVHGWINGKVSGLTRNLIPVAHYFFDAAAFGVFGAVSARAVFVAAPST
jgi:hypothetical protein